MKRGLVLTLLALSLALIALPGLAADNLGLTEAAGFYLPAEDAYKVIGVITNQGEKAVDLGMPRLQMLDKSGKPLTSGTTTVALPSRLEPGESAYFSALVTGLDSKVRDAITSFSISAGEAQSGGLVPLPTTVTSPLDQLNEEEGMVAEITNNTGKEVSRVRILWVLRDEAGKLIDVSTNRGNYSTPLADGAKEAAYYYFGFMTRGLAECLELGLEKGSAFCQVFAITD